MSVVSRSMRYRLARCVISLVVALGVVTVALPMAPAAGHAAAASYSVVSSAPCTQRQISGVGSISSGPEARFLECSYGGVWYVRPLCGVSTGSSHYYSIDQCYIFIWTTSLSYVGRFGFTQKPWNYSATSPVWLTTSSYLAITGYEISVEICAENLDFCWVCMQSPPHNLGS